MEPTKNFTLLNLGNLFTYHAPKGTQTARYGEISKAAEELARVIIQNAPEGPERDHAVLLVVQARMTANMSIAVNERNELEASKPVHPFGQ